MSCSILAMKQDKINMLLNVKRIMFVNMFYFLLFYLEIKTESVPKATASDSAYRQKQLFPFWKQLHHPSTHLTQ